MKRTSLLGSLALVIVSFTGCVIHSAHIDPYTGCRNGCSIEAVPDGPLDCCFYVRILRCPLFPWNWGQFLNHCDICDVPPCGGCGWGGGCGWNHGCGPAYPPMLSSGCCDTGFDIGGPGCCASSCGDGCGVGYGGGGMDFGGYPAPFTSAAVGGGCCDAPHYSHGPMPPGGPGMVPPGGPMHGPVYGDPVPQRSMPHGPLPRGHHPHGPGRPGMGMPMGPMNAPMGPPMGPMAPMPNPNPGMAPAALMPPTSWMPTATSGPSFATSVPTGPRVHSPYVTQTVDAATYSPTTASLPVVAPH